MQIIQTVNDIIRVLFNPTEEGFKLLDLLLVKDVKNKYIAQVVEIYDDKYDASQNVAKIKLFYKVDDTGEVLEYDNYTPNKECEIKKLYIDEILSLVNDEKPCIKLVSSLCKDEIFEINTDFFKNSAVIFADKLEHSNLLSINLAQALAREEEKSVIIDLTGTIEINGAKKLRATKDFKLPLDFYSLDYIWEKGLKHASLETQAICKEIFNEVQEFAKSAKEGFIPFNNLLNVVTMQHKITPIVELTVLLNNLKSYQKRNIFAQEKSDFEIVERTINDNEITIIDLSDLKSQWHKEFSDFVARCIKTKAVLFARLNDTNSDVDFINFIYDKNPQINFIPSVSYNYKKLPHITQRALNYMLLPTLSPKRDFGHANFKLASMAKDECILFGKDTEDFIFTIKNKELVFTQNNDKKQRSINLDFGNNEVKEEPKPQELPETDVQNEVLTEEELDFFQEFNQAQELSEISEEKKSQPQTYSAQEKTPAELCPQEFDEQDNFIEDTSENIEEASLDEGFEPEIEEIEPSYEDEIIIEDEIIADEEQIPQEDTLIEENSPEEVQVEFKDEEVQENNFTNEEEIIETQATIERETFTQVYDEVEVKFEEVRPDEIPNANFAQEFEQLAQQEYIEETIEENQVAKIDFREDDNQEDVEFYEVEQTQVVYEEPQAQNVIEQLEDVQETAQPQQFQEIKQEEIEQISNKDFETRNDKILPQELIAQEPKTEQEPQVQAEDTQAQNQDDMPEFYTQQVIEREPEIQMEIETVDLSEKIEIENPRETIVQPAQNLLADEQTEQEETNEDDISLESIAAQSIEATFDAVLDDRPIPQNQEAQVIISNDVVLDIENISSETNKKTKELPIFKDLKAKEQRKHSFQAGQFVNHEKYGKGEIIKVLNYSNRCLLQINFDQVGKRLLDPDIASIQVVE